jgi:glycosyltransferase involved in cell wall biosynthesis
VNLISQPISQNPKRLLITTDTVGGVWTYTLELTQALVKHGVEVAIATMGSPLSPEQCREAQRIPGLEVFASHFKLEWMSDPWHDVAQAGEWLLQLEAQLQPDVVHLNGYAHGDLPWRSPILMVGHSCVLSWWQAVRGEPAPGDWNQYQDKVARGLQAADLVVAPSQTMLAALSQHYGPISTGRVIPNGRDPSLFAPGEKSAFIFSVGRLWDEAKNVRMLDQIASALSWPIYVAGDIQHPQGGTVPTQHVHLLGHLSSQTLAPWLAQAAIYALPARYEPFGLSVLEAGLAGCALVVGDIPSLREIWGDAALFVPPDDPEALKATLQDLIASPKRRQMLAAKARDRALKFTPQRMASSYLQVYADLIANQNFVNASKEKTACKS